MWREYPELKRETKDISVTLAEAILQICQTANGYSTTDILENNRLAGGLQEDFSKIPVGVTEVTRP